MDIAAIRLQHLQRLVSEQIGAGKSRTQIALEFGLKSPSYLSQLLRGKLLGDKTARKIEMSLNLPRGYMDQMVVGHPAVGESVPPYGPIVNGHQTSGRWVPVTDEEAIVLTRYRTSSDVVRAMINAALQAADQDRGKPSKE